MISRIDHIAIAVKDYNKAFQFFTTIFGAVPGSYSSDDNMKYLWQNLALGDLTRLELLTPTGKGSFLDNFLLKKDGGVHHITLQTPDIVKAIEVLNKHKIPYFGYHAYGSIWKELFIHPRDAFGVLIQIAEFNADDWISSSVKMHEGTKYAVEKNNRGCSITFAHPGGGKVSLDLTAEEAKKFIKEIEKVI